MNHNGGLKAYGSKAVLALAVLFLSASAASAQRTIDGQDNISVSMHYTFSGKVPIGADLWWGRYLLSGNAKAGVSYSPFSHKISTTTHSESRTIQNHTILAHGEYMFRVVSNRGRHIGLYAGGGVFLGCELYDPQKRLPEYIVTGLGDCGFLYGINPAVEMELFFSRQTCIIIRGSLPINFSSPLGKVRYDIGIGARLNLF